jgi:myo-inositol catabolism protein IolC
LGYFGGLALWWQKIKPLKSQAWTEIIQNIKNN